MLFSGKWFDPVIGIDIHLIQPPGPVPPIPVPHPFIGIVYDPMGLAVGMAIGAAISGLFGGPFKGPVLINGMPAANTGMHVKGMPVHIPIGGVFVNPPSNEGTIITGSKTVNILGTSGARLTSMAITCNDPVNLPTSVVMSIPMGAPVFTGGPTAVDWLAAALSAIRTKWVSDKLHNLLGAEPGSWRSKLICILTGHPVDVASGRVLTNQVDFALPGPIPLTIERQYYSASTYNGPIGHGWHHTYDQRITRGRDYVWLRCADGRVIRFRISAESRSAYHAVERLDLEWHSNEFTVRSPDRRILKFSPKGDNDGTFLLTRIEDLNGNAITLRYAGDLLTSMLDSAGRLLKLSYDLEGRITSIDAPGLEEGDDFITVVRYEYDEAGDLIAALDAEGEAYTYAYKNHLLVRETNRNNLSFYFEYDAYEADGACVHTWGTGGIYDRKLTYNRAAGLTILETAPGDKTQYFWNEAGLVTKIVDALGGVSETKWDKECRKVCETDPNGSSFKYSYDSRGNLIQIVGPLGFGTTFSYDENRCLLTVTDALENVISREYDGRGNLVSFENQAGARWLYSADSIGRVRVLIEPNGRRLIQDFGNDGRSYAISDDEGLLVTCRLDGWGNLSMVRDRTGQEWHYTYDWRGKLRRKVYPDSTEVKFEYDQEGNLVSFANRLGLTTEYSWSGYNRITSVKRTGLPPIRYSYEASYERLTEVANELGEILSIEIDPLGQPIRFTNFDGSVSRQAYDAGGRRTRLVLGDAAEINYFYLPDNRLAEWVASDGTYGKYSYDAVGRTTAAVTSCGTVTRDYNNLHQIIKEQQGEHVTEFGFDDLGQRIWRINHSTNRRVDYKYDNIGRLIEVSDKCGLIQRFRYDAAGRLIERQFGTSALERYEYNQSGRVESQRVMDSTGQRIAQRHFKYDADGSLMRIEDGQHGSTTYKYDLTRRLMQVSSGGTPTQQLLYDVAGNLEYQTSIGVLDYHTGNRLRRAGEWSYEYDTQGRVIAANNENGTIYYAYDVLGRLRSVTLFDGTVTQYEYDAFDRRVNKVVNGLKTSFIWDGMTLLGEEDVKGNVGEYLFVPGSFYPLMHWNNSNGFHYIIDPLGTPYEMVDVTGNLAWQGTYTAFGELASSKNIQVSNRLRFQGQYWDKETGLHYNTYRYYDPLTNRFITPDPLGPLGGLNTYEYAINPINWVDPFGLMARPSGSPSQAIRDKLNAGDFGDACAACGRPTVGPGAVAKAQAEHMNPDSVIRGMEGFDELAKADQQAVRNLEDNFANLCQNCNASRQAKPYPDWPGHPDYPTLPGAISQLEQDAAAAKAKLEAEIEARKPKGCG